MDTVQLAAVLVPILKNIDKDADFEEAMRKAKDYLAIEAKKARENVVISKIFDRIETMAEMINVSDKSEVERVGEALIKDLSQEEEEAMQVIDRICRHHGIATFDPYLGSKGNWKRIHSVPVDDANNEKDLLVVLLTEPWYRRNARTYISVVRENNKS